MSSRPPLSPLALRVLEAHRAARERLWPEFRDRARCVTNLDAARELEAWVVGEFARLGLDAPALPGRGAIGQGFDGRAAELTLAAFGGVCAYCQAPLVVEPGRQPLGRHDVAWRLTYELDHVEPRVRGGHTSPANLLPVCRSCNRAKGGR